MGFEKGTALQAAEKVAFRIRVCLQAYRKWRRINLAFRRWRTDSYFFRKLFSRAAQDRQSSGL
jgi:hypothetical protein